MMVWSLFIIGLMGLFFYNKIGFIIPKVILPTTEIIEPKESKSSTLQELEEVSGVFLPILL